MAGGQKAGMAFILITVFIDVLGIGIIIPIIPELVKDFVGGSTSSAGRWFGILAATCAATQFLFAPVLGSLSDWFGRRPIILIALFGLAVATLSFLGHGIACESWMIYVVIIFGSLGGVTGPAIQGMIAGTVASHDQGKIQGAITSLVSLTSIFAPLIFAAGLFSYFTSPAAPFDFPGAPFLLGSVLWAVSFVILLRLFRRLPAG